MWASSLHAAAWSLTTARPHRSTAAWLSPEAPVAETVGLVAALAPVQSLEKKRWTCLPPVRTLGRSHGPRTHPDDGLYLALNGEQWFSTWGASHGRPSPPSCASRDLPEQRRMGAVAQLPVTGSGFQLPPTPGRTQSTPTAGPKGLSSGRAAAGDLTFTMPCWGPSSLGVEVLGGACHPSHRAQAAPPSCCLDPTPAPGAASALGRRKGGVLSRWYLAPGFSDRDAAVACGRQRLTAMTGPWG